MVIICVQVLRLGMFEVHCDELIRSLAKRADNLRNKLMVKMCRDHQEENKKSVASLAVHFYVSLICSFALPSVI